MPVTEDVPTTTVSTTTTPAYVPFDSTSTVTGLPEAEPSIVEELPKPVMPPKSGRALNWSPMGGGGQSNSTSSGAINFVTTISTPSDFKPKMDLSDVSMDDDDDETNNFNSELEIADGRSTASSPSESTTTSKTTTTTHMASTTTIPHEARLLESPSYSSSSTASMNTEGNSSPSSIDTSGECSDNGITYKVSNTYIHITIFHFITL